MAVAPIRMPTNRQAGSDLSLASYRWDDPPQTPAHGSALRTRHPTFHVAPDGVKAKPSPQMHSLRPFSAVIASLLVKQEETTT